MGRRKGNSQQPTAILKPLDRRDVGRQIRLGRPVCVIGSGSRVHLRLPSGQVSRVHALILNDRGDFFVRDLSSRNGTFLNGHPVREQRIRNGDVLCIGAHAFRWCGPPGRRRHPKLSNPPTGPRAALELPEAQVPYEIFDRTVLIGRRGDCDVALKALLVDPVHAVLFFRDGKVFVRDLNSRGGTFVNGVRHREAELHDGDEVRMGLSFVRFRQAAGTAVDPTASAPTAAPVPVVATESNPAVGLTALTRSPAEIDLPSLAAEQAAINRQRRFARQILSRLNDTAFQAMNADAHSED